MLRGMISSTSLSAFSVGHSAAAPGGAMVPRPPSSGAALPSDGADGPAGDGPAPPAAPPGRFMPRGSLLNIVV
jgi:hypothetical protein